MIPLINTTRKSPISTLNLRFRISTTHHGYRFLGSDLRDTETPYTEIEIKKRTVLKSRKTQKEENKKIPPKLPSITITITIPKQERRFFGTGRIYATYLQDHRTPNPGFLPIGAIPPLRPPFLLSFFENQAARMQRNVKNTSLFRHPLRIIHIIQG